MTDIENQKLRETAMTEKKWKIKTCLCSGGDMEFKIFSPTGLTARAWVFPDGRLSKYGIDANVKFTSKHLRFSNTMISRLKKAGEEFILNVLPVKYAVERVNAGMGPYRL